MDPTDRLVDAVEMGVGLTLSAEEAYELLELVGSLFDQQDDMLDFMEDNGITIIGRRSPEECN